MGKIAISLLALCLTLPALAQQPIGRRPILQRIREARRPGGVAGQRLMPPVVRRALAAALTLRFSGRRQVTVLRDGQPNRHEEIVMRDGPRARIEFPPDGPYAGQVIVEDATERRHFLPDLNEVRVLPVRRDEGLQPLRNLIKNGSVTTETGERIAGYATVEVTARDGAGNLIQRLAIEPESGMVLRRRFYDGTGTESGGFVFTRVDLTPAPFPATLFKIDRKGAKVMTPYDQLRTLAKKVGYSDASLPPNSGFRLDSVRLVKLPEGRVLAQIYVGPGGGSRCSNFRRR